MSLSKRNLIIIGAIVLVLIIGITITFRTKKNTDTATENTDTSYRDFDTELEEPTPTNTPKPTATAIPTRKPTSTPIPTNTPIPTKVPTSIPRPTRVPTATPTPDNNTYATGVVLNVTELTLTINESYQVNYRVEPNNTTDQNVYWSSDHGDIASVTSNGYITGRNIGQATITATTSNNMTTTIKVTVVESKVTIIPTATPTPVDYPTHIDLSLARLILEINETKQLYVKYQPENIKNRNVVWSVNNGSVITITADGLITGISSGVATVSVETVNGLTDTATIIVDPFNTGFSVSSTTSTSGSTTSTPTPTPTTTSTIDLETESSLDVAYESFITPGGLSDSGSTSDSTTSGYEDNYETSETAPSSWVATYHPYQDNMIPAGADMTKYQTELSKKIILAGARTREAVVAAALYLAEDFPYSVPYYPGGYSGSNIVDNDGGFWGNGDGTYTSKWGSLVDVHGNGHSYSGLSCGGFLDWAYLTAGFRLKNGETFTRENTEWISNTNDCATVASRIKPADLIYKREQIDDEGTMKITHVALIVDIIGDVVKYAHSSGGYGVNIQYIDICDLTPVRGGKNSFTFYVSMDKYFAAYGAN